MYLEMILLLNIASRPFYNTCQYISNTIDSTSIFVEVNSTSVFISIWLFMWELPKQIRVQNSQVLNTVNINKGKPHLSGIRRLEGEAYRGSSSTLNIKSQEELSIIDPSEELSPLKKSSITGLNRKRWILPFPPIRKQPLQQLRQWETIWLLAS